MEIEPEKTLDDELEVVEQVRSFLERCVKEGQLDLTCQCEASDQIISVELEGADCGLVLRDNARLLYAFNHLLNQAFYTRTGRRYNFTVDCEDYRGTRVMELQLLAQKAAEKVRLSGKPFQLQAMPSSERRVIHLALAEEAGVGTLSEGNGVYRRVVILPGDERPAKAWDRPR